MSNSDEHSAPIETEVRAPINPMLSMGPVYAVLCALAVGVFAWGSGFTSTSPISLGLIVIGSIFLGAVYAVTSQIINSLIYSASEILFAPYGLGDREEAFLFLKDYLLHGILPVLKISEGKLDPRTLNSPMAKLSRGPGRLEVDNQSVALIESGGMYRIVTANYQWLDKNDRIVGYQDLRIQRSEFPKLPNVFTKDNIPLGISIIVQYRLVQQQSLLPRHSQPTPNIQAVISALSASDWKFQIESTMRGKIRDLLAEYNLNDIHGSYPEFQVGEPQSASKLFEESKAERERIREFQLMESKSGLERTLSPRVPLQSQLKEGLDEAVRPWGAEVLLVTVDEITMPDEVQKTLREAWAAHWRNTMDIEKADMNAVVERIDAEGQRAAAEIKKEAALIDAHAAAESHRIKAMARADVRLEATRIMEAIRQVTGREIDESLLREMLRDVSGSYPEMRRDHTKRNTKPEEGNGDDQSGETS